MDNSNFVHRFELRSNYCTSSVDCISAERVFIMGLAMVSIMLFHQSFISGVMWLPFRLFGHFGVDIFLFLSGMGIACSLQRNNLKTFYRNRFVRILPAWLLVKLAIYVVKLSTNEVLLGFGAFATEFFNLWFLDVLIVFYVLSPWLLASCNKFGLRGIVWTAIGIEFFLAVYVCGCFPDMHLPLTVGLGLPRLPVYLLGLLMVSDEEQAKKVLVDVKLSLFVLFAAMLVPTYLFVSGYLVHKTGLILPRTFAVHFFAFPVLAFAVPCVCSSLAKLGRVLKKWKIYLAVLPFGVLSLELYLWHGWLYSRINMWMHSCGVIGWLCLLVGIGSSLVLAWLTHGFCNWVVMPLAKRN